MAQQRDGNHQFCRASPEPNEQDTLSASGDSYTGTFTEDVYDPKGNHVDHVVGTVVAVLLTVDSTLPTSIPSNPIQ